MHDALANLGVSLAALYKFTAEGMWLVGGSTRQILTPINHRPPGNQMAIRNIFNKTDRPIGRASDWIGVSTFASGIVGAISWPTSSILYVAEHGWGAILLSSIVLTCLLMSSMGIFLVGYRRLRPIPTDPDSLIQAAGIRNDVSNLEGRVEGLIVDLEKARSQFAKLHHQTTPAADEQDIKLKYIENMITGIQENHNNLRESIREAFSAQRSKGIFDDVTDEIEILIKNLSEIPGVNEDVPDWSTWDMYFNRLKSKLQYFVRFSNLPELVRSEIFNVPSEKFKSQYWTFDDSSMTEDQKHDYKTFRIIAANYREAKSKIHSAILESLYRSV